jgi:hypothetical protein
MTNAIKCLAAVLIAGGLTAGASAQNAPATESPPKADAGTTGQTQCISEDDHYVRLGKGFSFRIELTNKREQRIRCKVFVYITSAKGTSQGRATIVLAQKSRGPAATGTFTMKAKMNGGSTQSTRECRVF